MVSVRYFLINFVTLLLVGIATAQGANLSLPVISVEAPTLSPADAGALQKTLGIVIGQPLDSRAVDGGIREIVKQGKIQMIRVEALDRAGGIHVILSGSKIRKVRKAEFRDVEAGMESEVRRKVSLNDGDMLDTRAQSNLRQAMRLAFESRGYYFSDVRIEMTETGGDQESNLVVTGVPGRPTLIRSVSVSGGTPEENARIAASIPLRSGQRFTQGAVDQASSAITDYLKANQYATSKVEGTNLSFTEDKFGVDVLFSVRIGKRFLYLFSGNTVYEDRDLKSLMTDEVMAQTDSVGRITGLIEGKYRGVGYHFCKVTQVTTPNEKDRIEVVEFRVAEGEKVIIDRIEFGNTNEVEGTSLASLYFANAPGVLSRGIFWEDGLGEAAMALKAEFESLGYFNSVISGPKIIFSEDKKGVQLLYDVDLGARTMIAEIVIEGNTALSTDVVREVLPFRVGDPLNRDRLEEGRVAVIEKFQSEGFIEAKLTNTEKESWASISRDFKSAEVLLPIEQGSQYLVGDISIDGTRKTEHIVIEREMQLKKGDKLDPQKLRQSEENISLLGLFQRVELVTTTSPSSATTKDIRIVVRENKPGLGEIGLGGRYEDPRLRLRGFFGLAYRNLGGWNQTASARTEIGLPFSKEKIIPFVEHATVLGYRAPYPFGIPLTFSGQVGLDSFEVSTIPSKLQTRARIEGKIEKKLSSVFTALYRLYHYERTKIEDRTTGVATIDGIGSTGPGVIVDLRNDPFNPTKGSYHTLDLEFAHPALLSRTGVSFIMVQSRNSFYIPLASPFSFSGYLGGGYAKSLIAGSPLPNARLVNDLSLGGQTSIRGFGVRRFSPDGFQPEVTAFFNARAELATALFANLSAAVFFDSGQIFPSLRSERRHDGVGFGFRYKTPVGPVVIDIAQGLGPDKEAVRFYFTVGTL